MSELDSWMSAMGQKRTSDHVGSMSALPAESGRREAAAVQLGGLDSKNTLDPKR
jgi:hypothetical protein